MITVKFFGLISVNSNIKQLSMNAGKVSEVLEKIHNQYPRISKKELMQAMVVINKQVIMGKKRLTMILKDGDELVLLNPSSGG